MAQPDPDPDPDPGPDQTASEAPSDADGYSTTEDLPTTGEDNSSPMEDIGHSEDIPVDVASMPERLQPVQECLAPVHMARTSSPTADIKDAYVLSVCDGMGCLALSIKKDFSALTALGYTKLNTSQLRNAQMRGVCVQ